VRDGPPLRTIPAIMTSPATVPVGLLIVRLVVLELPELACAVARWLIVPADPVTERDTIRLSASLA